MGGFSGGGGSGVGNRLGFLLERGTALLGTSSRTGSKGSKPPFPSVFEAMPLGLSLAREHGSKLKIYVCLGTGGSRVDNRGSDKATLLRSDVEVNELDWVVSSGCHTILMLGSQEDVTDTSRIIGLDSSVPG